MKSNIVLKIGGFVVDTTDDVLFSITKQFKDMSNPCNIINDWTKTIVIPFTINNNKIFGHIYDPDRKLITSDTENIGLYFDPSKKVDFLLFWNESLLMEGYMKMSSIEHLKGYSINLFGGLGKVFSELRKLAPVLTEEITDEKYLIDPLNGGFYLTKENVYKSWGNARSKYAADPLVSTIGFAPTNSGLNDKFESKTIQLTSTSNRIMKFSEILDPIYEKSIYDVDSLIGDGILPRQIGDYRSYYQLPYIFVDKMFETLAEKTKLLTDYTLELDDEWFSVDNPYYSDSVMLLKTPDHNAQSQNTYAGHALDGGFPGWSNRNRTEKWNRQVNLQPIEGVVQDSEILAVDDRQTLRVKYALDIRLLAQFTNGWFTNLSRYAGFFLTIQFVDADNPSNILSTGYHIIVSEDNNWTEDELKAYGPYEKKYVVNNNQWSDVLGSSSRLVHVIIDGDISLKKFKFSGNIKMRIQGEFHLTQGTSLFNGSDNCMMIAEWLKGSILNYNITSNDNRSFDFVTFNDIWDNDSNFFDLCLKYTKMFNLIWDVDDIEKKITIMPLSTYFRKGASIEDWTSKVDFKTDYKIEPLIYDAKYYKLGYEESEIGLGEAYEQRYGSMYGDKLIDTKYNFNDSTNNLIEGLKSPIVNTTSILSWNDIYKANIVYQQCLEPRLCLSDNSELPVSGFGMFMFYRGLQQFYDLGRDICLSDDTQLMQNTNSYTYIESSDRTNGIAVHTYPLLDVVYTGQNFNLGYFFGRPKMKFDVTADYSSFNTIYDICWDNYLKEYTSPQNHKILANIYLSPKDFLMFKFNKMVKIGNQVYIVNKISDYNFTDKTKCELIRVDNISNYTGWTIPEPDSPEVEILSNNMAATNYTDDMSFTVRTNMSNFNTTNILITYTLPRKGVLSRGLLTIKSIAKEGNDVYNVTVGQSGFTAASNGQINIVFNSKRQQTAIVLESISWKIVAPSVAPDPIIRTDRASFLEDYSNVADFRSPLNVEITSDDVISVDNIEIETTSGSGLISISALDKINNVPAIYRLSLSQSSFANEGGSGNIIINSNDEVAARIPWNIVGNSEITTPSITTHKIVITDIHDRKIINTLFVDTDELKLYAVQDEEMLEAETVEVDLDAYVSNEKENRLLITYSLGEIKDVAINTDKVKLYKNGLLGLPTPPRGDTPLPLDIFELAEVVDIDIK